MKVGICGTGDISHSFMQSAKPISSIEVSGVYHREIEKAQGFAQRYQISHFTDEYSGLLEKCDCVYIGLPNSLHYSFSKQAILAGKHVLIEKPIVSNTRELKELFELANQYKVMIFEVDRVSFSPNFKWIQEKMKEWQKEKMIQVSFCKQSRRYFDYMAGKNPNVFTTKFSGGALYDLGVYGIHFVVGLLGAPTEIDYTCHLLESGVDGLGSLTLSYKDCIAVIQISKITHGPSSFFIQAVEGSIQANTSVSVLKELEYFDGEKVQMISKQQYDNFTYFLMNATEIILEDNQDRYQETRKQSILVLELMEEARRQNQIVFECDK